MGAIRYIIACLSLWVFCQAAVSQQLFLADYGEKRPSNATINAMVEDRNGMIWLGTDKGLEAFDGNRFVPLGREIIATKVTALLHGQKGVIYCGGDFGLALYKDEWNARPPIIVAKYAESPSDSTIKMPIALLEDSKGRLWINEGQRIARYWQGKIKHYEIPWANQDTLVMTLTTSGQLWVHAKRKAKFAYFEDGHFVDATFKSPFTHTKAIHAAGNNKFWIFANGIYETEISPNAQLSPPEKLTDFNGSPTTFANRRNGTKYLGTTHNGILSVRWYMDSGWQVKTVYHTHRRQTLLPLPFKSVSLMYEGNARELWVVADQTVYLIKSAFFQNSAMLPYYNTYAIAEGNNGHMYMAMGEAYKAVTNRGMFEKIGKSGFESGFASGIATTAEGVWVSDIKGQIRYFIQGEEQRTIDLSGRGGSVFNLYARANKELWACQAPNDIPLLGVTKIGANQPPVFFGPEQGLSTRVLVVKAAPDHQLYFGGTGVENYLFSYDTTTHQFQNLSQPLKVNTQIGFEVHDLTIDSAHTVWMATTHGVFRYDTLGVHQLKLGSYTQKEARAIALSPDGALWIATSTNGLIYYKNGVYVNFHKESGLPSEVMAYRCLLVDQQGYLWVGTAQGTVRSWTNHPVPSPTPKPAINAVYASGKQVSLDKTNASFAYGSDWKAVFQSVRFSVEGMAYQTRIMGIDEEWSEPTYDTTFTIQDLESGAYTFQVRAKCKGGYAWSEPTSYHFNIMVQWYKAYWAYLTYFFIGGAFVWRVSVYNAGQLKKEKMVLKQKVESSHAEIKYQQKTLDRQNNTILMERKKLEEAQKIINLKNEELHKANARLEEKVEERTRDLHIAYDELDATNKELDEFIYHSAHDLRGPVSTLLGLCYLALLEKEEHMIDLYLRKIEKSGQSMNLMLLKMMEAHEIKSMNTINPELVDINVAVSNAINKLPEGKYLNEMSVNIIIESGATIVTDKFLLDTLLRCLISNAIRYRDMDKPKQTLEVSLYINHLSQACLSVKDNGIGIANAIAPKVFDMFFKGTVLSSGAGLGLYEAKIIAEKLNGQLSFISVQGEMTEFVAILPSLEIPQEEIAAS